MIGIVGRSNMATEEFISKNNTTPEGGWQRSSDLRIYHLTRGEAVKIIADLAAALALPGGTTVCFDVEDCGADKGRVLFTLMKKSEDPSLRY